MWVSSDYSKDGYQADAIRTGSHSAGMQREKRVGFQHIRRQKSKFHECTSLDTMTRVKQSGKELSHTLVFLKQGFQWTHEIQVSQLQQCSPAYLQTECQCMDCTMPQMYFKYKYFKGLLIWCNAWWVKLIYCITVLMCFLWLTRVHEVQVKEQLLMIGLSQ